MQQRFGNSKKKKREIDMIEKESKKKEKRDKGR
jgi:hypothetical protein